MSAAFKPPQNPVIAIVGTTGTGKSQLAVELARSITARYGRVSEVINADAMQLYAGLPIITNKITLAEQRGVKHHLLGCISVTEQPWTVGEFVKEAKRVMEDVHQRGGVPVLVGGTHYYLQNLLFDRGLVNGNEASRQDVEDGNCLEESTKENIELFDLDEMDTEQLYAQLQEVDPTMAARWHPKDRRKIRRSLEIWQQTGKKASDVYNEQQSRNEQAEEGSDDEVAGKPGTLVFPTLMFWAHTERDVLVERLNKRVDRMLTAGLLDEVSQLTRALEDLEAQGNDAVDQTRGIWVSIGFKQFRPYLQSLQGKSIDKIGLEQLLHVALEETKGATRQYAKSQLKWIRIKLLLALRDADATNVLWPLSTDFAEIEEHWTANVAGPATKLATTFLEGKPLPRQEAELAPPLMKLLQPRREYDLSKRQDLWVTKTCQTCNVTATTAIEWERHVQGNRHTKLLRKHRQRQARAHLIPDQKPCEVQSGED